MNPLNRQHAIREFDLFVTGGVQEVPESVFETDTRAAGELRVVREQLSEVRGVHPSVERIVVGKIKIDLSTGEIVDE